MDMPAPGGGERRLERFHPDRNRHRPAAMGYYAACGLARRNVGPQDRPAMSREQPSWSRVKAREKGFDLDVEGKSIEFART